MDGTLTESRAVVEPEMATLLVDLLERWRVVVVSGCGLPRFKDQLLAGFREMPQGLILFPCCGTQGYEVRATGCRELFKEVASVELREKVKGVLEEACRRFGIPLYHYGDTMEDRESVICLSALGKDAPVKEKKAWDPDRAKRMPVVRWVQGQLPDCEVHAGGTTTVTVTPSGLDKGHCVDKIEALYAVRASEILFVGNELDEEGNDYPIVRRNVESVAVAGPDDTKEIIRGLLADWEAMAA